MTDAMASSTTEQKYNMMSVPFEAVDGKGISLQDINFANPTYTLDVDTADRIMFWKPDVQDYEQFYFYGLKDYEDVLPPTWKTLIGDFPYDEVHSDGMPCGTVFWYRSAITTSAIEQSMTSSGAVASDAYQAITITHKVGVETYYFIANPYPTDVDISYGSNEMDWGEATYTLGPDDADRIMVWDSVNQDYVQFYYYGFKDYEESLTPTWQTVVGDIPFTTKFPKGLPAGTGFWYRAYRAQGADFDQTIRFNNPIK